MYHEFDYKSQKSTLSLALNDWLKKNTSNQIGKEVSQNE